MAKKKMHDDALVQIEETQAAIREGIDKAKALVHEYEQRVRPQPEATADPDIPNPAV